MPHSAKTELRTVMMRVYRKKLGFKPVIKGYRPTFGMIADGYKEGADALADATAEKNATLDLAIYPIVFLYRQYLELRLKEIIVATRQLENEGNEYPPIHDLSKLWAEASRLLRQHYQQHLPTEVANVQSCIDEFHSHDPQSFAFRYPTDRNGKLQLTDLRHINLRNLYQTMGRIANLLNCLVMDLDERLNCMYEMQAEYRE